MSADHRWSRPYFRPTGKSSHVNVVAFASEVPDADFDPTAEDGWPDGYDLPDSLTVRPFDLTDPEERALFDVCLHGSIRERAEDVLGPEASRLDSARFALAIEGEVEDPEDLAYLQCVHATLRWLARTAGAFAALDYVAVEWTDVTELASDPARAFGLGDWIGMVMEMEPDPRFGRVLHTRGMSQFGRPDLMMLGFREDVPDAAGTTIVDIATKLAFGLPATSGERMPVAHLSEAKDAWSRVEVALEALRRDENGPDIRLGSDALILRIGDDVLGQIQLSMDFESA
jgi:hypothetical protein